MALILGFFLLWFGFLWVNHCGHLGPLETFLRGLCCQKYWKTHVFFNVFLRMLLLGFLMPLMVVLSHLLLSLAGFHPPWLPKWDSKRFKQSSRIKSTMNLKISKKSHQNGFPKIVQNEIASLRHFLPRRHFWGFFLADFFRAFGALWVLLGRLLGFLRLSWEASGPKNV